MTTLTPQDLRDKANEARLSARESFERCGDDGFVTQKASEISADRYELEAELLENGGLMDTVALFLDGELASTHLGFGQYGSYWVLNDAAAEKYGKRFFSGSRATNFVERDRAKGFTWGTIRVRGYVTIKGSGKGFSGLYSCRAVTLPIVEDLKSNNFEIIETDGYYGEVDA
jgi:hypothetical protein